MKSRLIPDGSGRDGRRQPEPGNQEELLLRAQALEGFSVQDLAHQLGFKVPENNVRSKGFVGQLVERALGADPKAGELPDFPGLGVELKTIPIREDGRPSESTFVCSIRMESADRDEWETSRLYKRLKKVLFLPVESSKMAPLSERRFGRAALWQPTATEWQILHDDWEDLMGAIGSGRGGNLSAREGVALQVRPKASDASVRTMAPGAGGLQMSLPLGFYMRAHITQNILTSGHIVEDSGRKG